MTAYHLDASAWVKRYHAETGTAWVGDLLGAAPVVACASLGLVKATAALARLAKAQGIAAQELAPRLEGARADWERMVQVRLTDKALQGAAHPAEERALRGADAVHLASALVLRELLVAPGETTAIVTSDHELAETARQAGLEVLGPETEEADDTRVSPPR